MSQLNTFTSTGNKLFRNGIVLANWNDGIAYPQSLQVALTEVCNLKCRFCSVANRKQKYVFDFCHLLESTKSFIDLGIKTIEITGGGDPLMYPALVEYLSFLDKTDLKIGLITNGISINSKIPKQLRNRLAWIRISSNVLDYKDQIDIPEDFTGTLGFSYCWTEGLSTLEQLERIKQIALQNNVQYIRLVPNCLATHEQQEINNRELAKVAETVGHPLFFQPKIFNTPPNCFWGYLKPFLYCDEFVYPCSSTVLNETAEKQFNPTYRWYHYKDIDKVYSSPISSILDTAKCTHCVFSDQNKILEYALDSQLHEDFI